MRATRTLSMALGALALTATTAALPVTAGAVEVGPADFTTSGSSAGSVAAQAAAARSVYVNADSNSADISAVQILLTAAGHATDVDGSYGPKTTAAVKAFQTKNGLEADGKVGPKTIAKLGPKVKEGAENSATKAVQRLLNKNGASLDVDGKFGPATKGAVVDLQKRAGLSADGVVGPDTWSYLFGPVVGGGGGGGDCGSVNGGVPQSATKVVSGTNIRVHDCWDGEIAKMVAAAKADGVTLTANSSWRSPDEQKALRNQNCPGATYQIRVYETPSSNCSPPTAKPGVSRHERGLAIDFANSSSHSTAVFKWLAANGAKYGAKNLPSEPWHWSIDGH
ncbi:peptidoglycan-binding protein [Propionibacteriaceae bacterium Y1700]|uniref:peptidoglycan-binding protein n=1 Tax=Microlunatus sp. Y1700 TaxID=3418487 RepID=UPI003DA6DCB3